MIQTICDEYNLALKNIFENNKRVNFNTCHDCKDFTIRSQEREILYAIKKYHKDKYNIYWEFNESFYGKCIVISIKQIINNCKTPDFSDFEKYYKEEFISRMNLILNTRNEKKRQTLKTIIDIKKIESPNFNYEKCKELRNIVEEMRNS